MTSYRLQMFYVKRWASMSKHSLHIKLINAKYATSRVYNVLEKIAVMTLTLVLLPAIAVLLTMLAVSGTQ